MLRDRCLSFGRRRARPVALAAAACALAVLAACRDKPQPIRVDRGRLVIENQTSQEWRNVTVTVNAYYRGGSRTLAPGGRLETSLTNFVSGLGQRFDTSREQVRRVEVRATSASGEPVAIDWGAAK
jgi:hypothetical protein